MFTYLISSFQKGKLRARELCISLLLYCKYFKCFKFWTPQHFRQWYYQTLFLPEIKIVQNFLQIMY